MEEARRQLGPSVAISLLSVPDAAAFYERIGMKRMPDAFWFSRERRRPFAAVATDMAGESPRA